MSWAQTSANSPPGPAFSSGSGALFLPKVLNSRLGFNPEWEIITGCDSSDPLWGGLTMGGGICCGNMIFFNFFFLWGTAPKCWDAALEAVVVTGGIKIRNLSTFLHSHMALGQKTIVGCLILGGILCTGITLVCKEEPKVAPEDFVQPNFPVRGWDGIHGIPSPTLWGWFGILWEKWQSKVWSYKKKKKLKKI